MAYSREIEKLERQFAENPRRFAAPFADALRKNDEVPRALEVIRVGLELNPDYIPGSVILGRCHLDLGDDHAAEAAFSRVLDLDNENVIALKSLADIMERQGRHDEAVRFLSYLLEVDRSNDEARQQLARIQSGAAGAVPTTSASPVPPVVEDVEPVTLSEPIFGAPPGGIAEAPPSAAHEFLEPTALWEPPAADAEAVLSSWVEPTALPSGGAPEPGESLLAEPVNTGEFAPLEGLEGMTSGASEEPARFEEFVLEREEEIVLNSASGAEYQVANDSESLLDRARAARPAAEPPVEEAAEATPPAPLPGPSSIIAEELRAPAAGSVVEPEAATDDEAPFEWAMHVGEGTGFVPTEPAHTGAHPPDSFDAAIEGIAPVDEEAPSDEEGDAGESSPVTPVLVVTESMAELYASQGHPGEALGVYRILFDRNPDNARLRQRIHELEAALAEQAAADASPSYAASVTGGKAVSSFLGGLLQARPAPVDVPEPPPAPELTSVARASEEGGEEAVASGAPTRPAGDRLSLGAIFGEDPSPVPPAEAAAGAKAEGAGGFSFDDFFGGGESAPGARTATGSVRAARPADDDDDLDQFHTWLQSLKR